MAAARVISTERFVVKVTNGQEREMSKVSDEKGRMGAESWVAAQLCVM